MPTAMVAAVARKMGPSPNPYGLANELGIEDIGKPERMGRLFEDLIQHPTLRTLQLVKRDAERRGQPLRSYLRRHLGIPDPGEPAPWKRGGAWRSGSERQGFGGARGSRSDLTIQTREFSQQLFLLNDFLRTRRRGAGGGNVEGGVTRAGRFRPMITQAGGKGGPPTPYPSGGRFIGSALRMRSGIAISPQEYGFGASGQDLAFSPLRQGAAAMATGSMNSLHWRGRRKCSRVETTKAVAGNRSSSTSTCSARAARLVITRRKRVVN